MFLVRMMLTSVGDVDRWERERGHPMLKSAQLAIDNPEWLAAAERGQLALLDSNPD